MKARWLIGIEVAALIGASVPSWGMTYDLNKNDVVPIKFETKVSTATAQVGDPIKAVVDQDSDLPKGTEFLGHVDQVSSATDSANGSFDLSFDQIKFKNGTIVPITAVPIPLDKKYVDKMKDGHYVGKPDFNKGTAVGAGALAGLLIGSLINKPFEGTFIGTLIGIVVGETNTGPQQVTINKGKELGAYIQETVTLDDDPNSAVNQANATGGQGQLPIDPTGPSSSQDWIVNGVQLQFPANLQPFKIGNSVMVPLANAAGQLDLQITDGTQFVYVDSAEHSLRIEKNSTSYRLDGATKTASVAPVEKDGNFFVPIEMLNAVKAPK